VDKRIPSALRTVAPQIETAVCLALAFLLLWKGILPAWRVLNTDFPNYYLVARLIHEGYSVDRIYDWVWLQRIKDHWGLDQSLVGFAGLTPFSALPILPLATFSALTAKRIWIISNLVFLGITAEALHRSTSLSRRRIYILSLLAIYPLRTNFLYGQMHLLVLLFLALAWAFHRRNREIVCGCCIALAGALKIYPLLFAFYFLWKRQWTALAATIIAAIGLIAATSAIMGHDILRIYALQILPSSLRGEALDPYHWRAASASALFHRFFLFEPSLNPAPLINSPSVYAVVYPLWQTLIVVPLLALIRPGSGETEEMEWAAFLLALLVLSPVPSSYHFVVMILPVALCVDVLLRRGARNAAGAVILLYLLMSITERIGTTANPVVIMTLGFARLWLGLLIYGVFLFQLRRITPPATSGSRRRTIALAALACVAVVVSTTAYLHHFSHRDEQMRERLPLASAPYLATDPMSFSHGYLSVAMTPPGYRVIDQDGQAIFSGDNRATSSDQLSYAIGPGQSLVLELADANGSRIVRAADGLTLADNAESPAISSDGHTLAFIRENKGIGSLWTASLPADTRSNAAPLVLAARQLTESASDVRSIAFLPNGDLLFSAKSHGTRSLFTLHPGTPPTAFPLSTSDIGGFGLSPDGARIAFTPLHHGVWQLAVRSISSGETKILFSGDCNAYSPSWASVDQVLYATDCGRGLGLTAPTTASASR
jgi:hypothetical protein